MMSFPPPMETRPPRLRQATPHLGRPAMSEKDILRDFAVPQPMPERTVKVSPEEWGIDERPARRGSSNLVEQSNPPVMPRLLRHRLEYLEKWALQNKEDAHRDMIRFWSFKIPAILGAAAAPLIAYFSTSTGWALVGIIIGGFSAGFALIDGIYPSGMLRNVHYKAYHELRELQQVSEMRWETYCHKAPQDKLTQKLLEIILKKMEEIAKYIKEAEISLKH